MPQSHSAANRLADESSPYLQQHADNPVDWYPWGDEALRQADELKRPIFLSIGYSACHWCHVMAHESFENEEIAAFLNEHFVSIKVDREERPDLDAIYMNGVLAMTGRGGWPMSVFLTPDGRPFFGGTYWPPKSRQGMPGFLDILRHIDQAWRERGGEVEMAAAQLVNAINQINEPGGEPQTLNRQLLTECNTTLIAAADRRRGGFGGAPKFPSALSLRVLLRHWKRTGDQDALDVATMSLDQMARGGIFDQLGGGFHRYSTDGQWLVPHFEKMLYDQALLVPAYLEGWQATRRREFADVARRTLDYVLREMTAANGGFYSAQDADSEGGEGAFFTWTTAQLAEVPDLDSQQAALLRRIYGVTDGGNWEGTNILHRPVSWEEAAAGDQATLEELQQRLAGIRKRMLAAREKRPAPLRDEKQLACWNGLMISAFAQAGFVLGESTYLEAAERAADFLLESLTEANGELHHTYRDGHAKLPGFLDDYAAVVEALLDLYEADGRNDRLAEATRLADVMLDHFAADDGGLYFAPEDDQVFVRQQDSQDTATPSGTGLAASALWRLGRLTERSEFREPAERLLERLSGQMAGAPQVSGQSLMTLDAWLGPVQEILIAGSSEERDRFLAPLRRAFLPGAIIVQVDPASPADDLPAQPAAIVSAESVATPAVYLCEGRTCQSPIHTPEELRERLKIEE